MSLLCLVYSIYSNNDMQHQLKNIYEHKWQAKQKHNLNTEWIIKKTFL